MSTPPPYRGLLLLVLAGAQIQGCEEAPPETDVFVSLALSARRINVLDKDSPASKVTVTINAPSATSDHTAAMSISDYAGIIDVNSVALDEDSQSFSLVGLTAGKGQVGVRCIGKPGEAEIKVFLIDVTTGNVVGEATATLDCYYENLQQYRLGLNVTEQVIQVGKCVDVEVQGFNDNGQAADGLSVNVGCSGCRFDDQPDSVLDDLPAGELNKKSLFLDDNGLATAKLCCIEVGRVGVRTDWDEAKYGDPDRVVSGRFDCIAVGGEAGIRLAPDREEVRVGTTIEDNRTEITLTLLGVGAVPQAKARINSISTNRGVLTLEDEETQPPQGAANQRLLQVETDDGGQVVVYFWGGIKPGDALISAVAQVDVPGQDPLILESLLTIPVIGLGDIECLPPSKEYLPVSGGGGADSSVQMCVRVLSTEEEPLPNFTVNFKLPDTRPCREGPSLCGEPWLGLTRVATDANGIACTTLHAGRVARPVSVRANGTLQGELVTADCPAIPVVGGRASARGLSLVCEELNIGCLLDTDGISSLVNHAVPCRILLKDRFGNPVPESTNVQFKSEAGTITHAVATPGRVAGGGSPGGLVSSSATAVFQTFGVLPKDVSPLPRDPDQGRERAEPSYQDADGRIRNPRDGLVTIIAYTVGEEEFTDLNGNGRFDPDEPFVDLAEPWVDYNDNGLRDLDEPFIDLQSADVICPPAVNARSRLGIHDGPNGCWDANGLIWTQTRLLYTGAPYARVGDSATSGFLDFGLVADNPRFRLQKGDLQLFKVRIVDENLNLMNPSFSLELVTRGPAEIIIGATGRFSVPDSLGMGFSFVRVCNSVTKICSISPRFTGFSEWSQEDGSGYDFFFTMRSNAPAAGPCCAPRPPPGSEDLPELIGEDRRDDRCQPPEGYAFPDELPEDEPGEGGGEEGEEGEEGEGEAVVIQPWDPALFEDTLLRVVINYSISPQFGGGPWLQSYEIDGWGCGTTVLSSVSEDDIEVPTSCMKGQVLDPGGNPIAGAIVRILDPSVGFVPSPSVTDDAGFYCLVSSLGRHQIQAEFEGEDGLRCASGVTSVQIESGESSCDSEDCRRGPDFNCAVLEGGGGEGPPAGDEGGEGEGDANEEQPNEGGDEGAGGFGAGEGDE